MLRPEEAPPGSPAFAALLAAAPRTAVLLPLAFFHSCSGANESAAEAYMAALRGPRASGPARAAAMGVWAFDAQAHRAAGVAALEPVPEQAMRYAAAARQMRAREAALYGAADVLAMLTEEDHVAAAGLSPYVTSRVTTHFREDAAPELAPFVPSPAAAKARLSGGGVGGGGAGTGLFGLLAAFPQGPSTVTAAQLVRGPSAGARARARAAALPHWGSRSGFCFLGGGNNPTNLLALHAVLDGPWAAIRAKLPHAQLHIIGPPPTALCKEFGVWCGWTAHSPYDGEEGGGGGGSSSSSSNGLVLHGAVADISKVLNQCRLAFAPMTCGTGVNTKVWAYMNAGLPIVGTKKAARGYFLPQEGLEGFAEVPDGEKLLGFAAAAVGMHEAVEEKWLKMSLSVLQHAAEVADARQAATDIEQLADALGGAVDARAAAASAAAA